MTKETSKTMIKKQKEVNSSIKVEKLLRKKTSKVLPVRSSITKEKHCESILDSQDTKNARYLHPNRTCQTNVNFPRFKTKFK